MENKIVYDNNKNDDDDNNDEEVERGYKLGEFRQIGHVALIFSHSSM